MVVEVLSWLSFSQPRIGVCAENKSVLFSFFISFLEVESGVAFKRPTSTKTFNEYEFISKIKL